MKNIKKIDSITKLLIFGLIYLTSIFCVTTCNGQEVYRDTILEKLMLEQVNIYRVEKGLTPFTLNTDNKTAVAWGEYLVTQYQEGLTHCMCQPGSEILANIPFVFDGDDLKLVKHTISSWDRSPMHKQQMVRPESERAFFAAIVYEGVASRNSNYKIKRVIFVGQFLHSKEYYVYWGDDETGGEFTHILDIHGVGKTAKLK
jgi:hypothetical protein